jgi:hypothetical protein
LAGIETMHMITKGQLDRRKAKASTAASQSFSLAFDHRPITQLLNLAPLIAIEPRNLRSDAI